jgi:hypothetical protein
VALDRKRKIEIETDYPWLRIGRHNFRTDEVKRFNALLRGWGYKARAPFIVDLLGAIATTGRFLWKRFDDGRWEMRHVTPIVVGYDDNRRVAFRPWHRTNPIVHPDVALAVKSVYIQAGFDSEEKFYRTQIEGIIHTGTRPLGRTSYVWDIPGKEILQ